MPVSAATEGRKPSGEVTAGSARKPPPIAVPARIAAASVVVVCSSSAAPPALQLTTGQGRRRPHEVESRVTRRGAAGDAGRSALAPARSANKRRLPPTPRMVRRRALELSSCKLLPISRELRERGQRACLCMPRSRQLIRARLERSPRKQASGPAVGQRPGAHWPRLQAPEKEATTHSTQRSSRLPDTVPWLEG